MCGFDGLISTAVARASGGAASSRRGEAASKLGMGAALCGHPVFMVGSGLGHKATREAWAARTPSGGGSVRAGHELEEGDNPDSRARRVSDRREGAGEERRGWETRPPVGPLRERAGLRRAMQAKLAGGSWANRTKTREGEKSFLFFFSNFPNQLLNTNSNQFKV